VTPRVDGGRYPVKRIVGDEVRITCDLVRDGHDAVDGALLYRGPGARDWIRDVLRARENDRYEGSFTTDRIGVWEFAIEAWIDRFASWRLGTQRKLDAGQDVTLELAGGAQILRGSAPRADAAAADLLRRTADHLDNRGVPPAQRLAAATAPDVVAAARAAADRSDATRTDALRLVVDPLHARFSAWYEMFPRSAGPGARHGTLRDVIERLPYVAGMGFDVLYLPPVHPIGRAFRKGPNNALEAGPHDVGSPWAIGAPEGGHKAVHPELGTLEDLRALVNKARSLGMEVALDIAFQASPDHPYVKEHPEWFIHRADGSIQYAENPPKKYQDVVPFDFECQAWESLWRELASVFHFWCEQGVRVFRVDNPHTKPIPFWEWCIADVKAAYPEALFLAEAFTRPKVMYALAKCGFTQSYTYFTWRHSKREFIEYVQELTRSPVADFFRPNFWPNTPDILPEHLQFGSRATFVQRLILAATLSSNYGIYGPPFELMERAARPGSEEYADNEKYQLRSWDLGREDSLRDIIALVNRLRRETPALQDNLVTFHATDDEYLIAYSKRAATGDGSVLVVVNLDAHHTHAGTVLLDLGALGVREDEAFQVHDVLADARYRWQGRRAYVSLDPGVLPASIFVVRRHVRTERDFDYFA
jgi:starch synthase (maltosyl-transferring)